MGSGKYDAFCLHWSLLNVGVGSHGCSGESLWTKKKTCASPKDRWTAEDLCSCEIDMLFGFKIFEVLGQGKMLVQHVTMSVFFLFPG